MDECIDWLARQGRWVEVGLIAAMVVVALVSFKFAVSAAGRVVLFVVTVALLGGGFYCLNRIRAQRRWITFRIEYRGRVVSGKGSGLRKGVRCSMEVEGRFQWFQIKEMGDVGPPDLKEMDSDGDQTSSSDKESGEKRGSISAECRLKLTCGDDKVMDFGPEGTCLYFHHEGRVDFKSGEGVSKALDFGGNRAVINMTSPEGKKEKIILRLRRTEIRKPVI